MVMMEWRWDDDDGMMDVWTRRMVGMVVAVLQTRLQLSLCRLTLRRSDDDDDGVDYKHGNDEEARVSRDVTITTSMMTMPDDDDENDNNNSQDEYDDNDNNTDDDDACGLGGRDQARAELAEEFRLRDAADPWSARSLMKCHSFRSNVNGNAIAAIRTANPTQATELPVHTVLQTRFSSFGFKSALCGAVSARKPGSAVHESSAFFYADSGAIHGGCADIGSGVSLCVQRRTPPRRSSRSRDCPKGTRVCAMHDTDIAYGYTTL
eukprot:981588-Rhodomonas_salina.2